MQELHFGSDSGGHSAAVIYTLIGSAKLVGIDAQAYLRHVLGRIADSPSNRIDELLPGAVTSELVKAWPMSSLPANNSRYERIAAGKVARMRVKQIEDLPMATSTELYQLSWVIEKLMAALKK